MAQLFFYFDQTRCMGCDTCTVQCKDFNGIKPGPVRWRSVRTVEEGAFPYTKVYNTVYSCNHCENPACIPACGKNAISKDEATGAVIIDRKVCSELGDCISACPYSAIAIADNEQEATLEAWETAHPAQKCDMCHERITKQIAQGKKPEPACVASCIQRALDFGTEEELMAKYNGLGDVARYTNGEVKGFPGDRAPSVTNTRPCIIIRRKQI